jgi:multiple sugar transport system substrate-binding protein
MEKITLNGISWNHSRGITPLRAAAQRYSELHPHIDIIWRKRSLQDFADQSISQLSKQFDFLVIDHPWCGFADETGCLLPLDMHLTENYLAVQASGSVGKSHESYNYNGHQWALAIDAALPAASYRPDLFIQNRTAIPQTWEELIELAKRGKVLLAGIPVDSLMAFYMFCIANGSEPFLSQGEVISEEIGIKALLDMKLLWSLCDPIIFKSNPIAVAEKMTSTDDFWYCPFAYCYSNYSRKGYAKNVLQYGGLISYGTNGELRPVLGGTGLSISSVCKNTEVAIGFASWLASPECQATFYLENSGQPAHADAWTSPWSNTLCNNFFANILPVMRNSFLRPRYNGYLFFQDNAAIPLFDFLSKGKNVREVVNEMNSIYRKSLTNLDQHA